MVIFMSLNCLGFGAQRRHFKCILHQTTFLSNFKLRRRGKKLQKFLIQPLRVIENQLKMSLFLLLLGSGVERYIGSNIYKNQIRSHDEYNN